MADGLFNIAIEDALAHAATEPERVVILRAGLRLFVEYLARETGRSKIYDALADEAGFVRRANPSTPWPP